MEDLSSDDEWLATEDVGDVGDDHDDDDDLFDRVAQHSPYNLIDEDDEGDDEGIRTTEKGKDMAVHQVSDEFDDDSGPPLGFERYRDFDDLPMDADAGQDNNDEMDSVDSDYDDYDDKNFKIDD
uniref:Uncharacterized protein n=1 Tax=Fagus sylvatica TaxID=28930 RepID=A0A2N9ILL1_FAGSY